MKLAKYFLAFTLSIAVAASASAAQSDTLRKLDEALEAAAAFEYGGNSGPLGNIETIVIESVKDPQLRNEVESRIIGTLIADRTTSDAKSFLCRQLRTIGTPRCVPALERLLVDPKLSHMARYALGTIEDPAAPEALHRALGKTSGVTQVGIINTLADRRHRPAARDIARLLRSSDPDVADAAARALGRMGGARAVTALESARSGASAPLAHTIDNALLFCAERFVAEGRNDDAARIYEKFYAPALPAHFRLAALRGLTAARGANAAPLLVDAIKGPDPQLRRSAISLMTMVKGADATNAFVALLPSLPPEGRALVLGALGQRGDRSAAPAVSAAAKSTSEPERLAALKALGTVGDASSIVLLAHAAATGTDAEKQAARAALLQLNAQGVDRSLLASIRSGDPGMRVEFIRALAGRGAKQAAPQLLKTATDDDQNVRREAIRALGVLAADPDLPSLVMLVVKPKDPKDRSPIEQAVAASFRRIADKDRQTQVLLDALAGAPADAKPTLLSLLGRPATAKALQAVRAALNDQNPDARDAAVRTISDWPDAAPAEDLLAIARTAATQTHKVLALRGYVRMAQISRDPAAMYVRAMTLADRPEDKRLVLGGLGAADSPQALELVERYLNDPQLQTEAGLAAVQIADRLRQRDQSRANAAVKKVLAVVKDANVRRKAQDLINEIEQYEGYILVWLASGPYTLKGKESRAVFDASFPPEKNLAEADWKSLTKGLGSWDVDLESTYGSKDHVGAYVRTRIFSPAEQDARLELGSDDSVKVWLNGKLVHEKYTSRGLAPRQDLVNVRLARGANDLMLKVVDHEGGWAFCCRVRKPDGSAVEGLRIATE